MVRLDRSSPVHDPYFLYAASNAGSLLALLAYPFVIEPNLGLTAQSQLWRTGFLILAILVAGLRPGSLAVEPFSTDGEPSSLVPIRSRRRQA